MPLAGKNGQKEHSSESCLGAQTWRFGPDGPRKAQTAKHMKKENPAWGGSLKSYQKKEGAGLSLSEEMIDATASEWFAQKHRRQSAEEIAMVNAIRIPSCPYCGSKDFAKDGRRKDGIQKLLCQSCGRRFNPLTGSVFDSKKIPMSEWIEYLLHLFEFHSIVTSARDNRNAKTTGFYWLRKVFAVLDGCQKGVVLEGTVWLDETFVSVDKPDRVSKDGKSLRGISRNKLAIATATDGTRLVITPLWTSKPSKRKTLEEMEGHIKPGSTLIHDGDNSHSLLVERLNLKSVVHKTAETKGLSDSENPMDRINDVHSLFKRFVRMHVGFSRADLQGWCDLFWFIWSEPSSRMDKIKKFLEMAVSTRKRIKFRDVFVKKADET